MNVTRIEVTEALDGVEDADVVALGGGDVGGGEQPFAVSRRPPKWAIRGAAPTLARPRPRHRCRFGSSSAHARAKTSCVFGSVS